MELPEFVKEAEIIAELETRGEENPYRYTHGGDGPIADLEAKLEWKNKEIFLLCTKVVATESELQSRPSNTRQKCSNRLRPD